VTYRDQVPGVVARLKARLDRFESRIAALERRGLVIPVLDEDPADEDPTNLWLLNDGRLRARDAEGRIREWVPTVDARPLLPTFAADPAVATGWRFWLRGSDAALRARLANDTVVTFTPSAGGSAADGGTGSTGNRVSTDPKPAHSQQRVHREVYSATDAKCYCPVHGVEGPLYYGRYSSTHGERRVMFDLPDATIRSDLDGAVVRKAELRVRNLHSYQNSGVDIHFGGHKSGSLPGSFSQSYNNVWSGHWPKVGGDTWREIPKWFGQALRDDKIRGLTIDQPSTSVSYYGLVHAGLDLRITYTV